VLDARSGEVTRLDLPLRVWSSDTLSALPSDGQLMACNVYQRDLGGVDANGDGDVYDSILQIIDLTGRQAGVVQR